MKAKAAMVMVNLETEECMFGAAFEDNGEGPDPVASCKALWDSTSADWPGWEPTYVANEEARELAKQREMWGLGMSDESDEMPARIETMNDEIEKRRAKR